MEKKNHIDELLLVAAFTALVVLTFFPSSTSVLAGIGTPNATVITTLRVGNVYPEIINVSIMDDAATVDLIANESRPIYCVAVVRDYNGEGDISNVNATFFSSSVSISDPDDNNNHYTNSSCTVTNSFGSYNGYDDNAYLALANCTFGVQYYATPGEWTCSVTVNDSASWMATAMDTIDITQLLALGLPDTMDYGLVNATDVSNQNITNVSNYGNVVVNLSLEGYGVTVGDGLAMNCTLGSIGTISIEHEKYNLTTSNTSVLTLGQADSIYTNLTTNPVVRYFNLTVRESDIFDDSPKSTYWRMYVPLGVAGNCSGNIIFGATTAAGS